MEFCIISDNIEIVGRRPGEKRDEDLISEHELSYTYVKGNDIHIRAEENTYDKNTNWRKYYNSLLRNEYKSDFSLFDKKIYIKSKRL